MTADRAHRPAPAPYAVVVVDAQRSRRRLWDRYQEREAAQEAARKLKALGFTAFVVPGNQI